MRRYRRIDRLFEAAENLLYACAAEHAPSSLMPGSGHPDHLNEKQKEFSGRLMRVNHAGELAAQGLYHGQMVFARDEETMNRFRGSAEEEKEHLAWCEQRLAELGAHPSYLSFFWYFSSVLTGMLVSLSHDRANFSFVRETEVQVMEHLQSHIQQLPENDVVTRELLQAMYEDEKKHATMAEQCGAFDLPPLVSLLMKAAAKVMTVTARHV